MRSATQIICAFLGISVIVSYHLLPRVAPGAVSDFAAAQIAGAGLALLMFAGLIWLTGKARKHTDQPAPVIALTGISLGALSGLLVALVFPFTLDLSLPLPPEFANDPAAIERAGVYRIERIVAFASIIGGGMYVLLQMLAKTTDRAVIPRTEQILSMVAAFSATFIFGVWLTHEVSGVGRAINTMTGGLITGSARGCARPTHGSPVAADLASPAIRVPSHPPSSVRVPTSRRSPPPCSGSISFWLRWSRAGAGGSALPVR